MSAKRMSVFLMLVSMILVSVYFITTAKSENIGSTVQRWEYTHYWPQFKENSKFSVIEAKLNELGNQGWELISVNAHNGSWVPSACYIFKRPKQ